MKLRYPIAAATLFCAGLLTMTAASAGDTENGKKLYGEHCTKCHDTSVHTRPNRIIHTYTDLANRVKFCDAAAKAGFADAQLEDVTDYLNATFYKYKKE